VSQKLKLQEELFSQRRTVDTEKFDITVRELVRLAASGELNSAPSYQRKFRWSEERESTLIESIFLGLPVPPLYVATNEDGRWELVDGVQRVSTLLHYVADPVAALKKVKKTAALKISGLQKLKSFNGKGFADLPEPLQLHFFKRSLTVTALSDKADASIRFDLFERLNRGGVSLTAQEVRACVYRGQFSNFLRRMSRNEHFRSLLKLRKAQNDDGTSEEVVLKFFAYLHNQAAFDGAVTEFLNDYMSSASKKFAYVENRELFEKVVAHLAAILNGPVLRAGTPVTPLNQLEAILVGAGRVLLSGKQLGTPKKGWLEDPTLVASSTKGTNTVAALRTRVSRAQALLSDKRKK
jgi:hypothetical protein